MKSIWVYVSVIAGLMSGAFLTSCNEDAYPSSYSPGGYWTGSMNGEPGVGLVDESGEFIFITADGEQYPGTLSISSAYSNPLSFSGSVQSFTPGKFPKCRSQVSTSAPCLSAVA